ncbi:MAG TPA: GvpL/GvpF family gas vesicle protein [Longimicrobium sp.]|jgi:hypothetical protein|uniref:GvpL/GvpF family gas vesicle protein n=1 Tax=Longimicrobium sp. TaxID=2029185 RepID=UPI002EDB4288
MTDADLTAPMRPVEAAPDLAGPEVASALGLAPSPSPLRHAAPHGLSLLAVIPAPGDGAAWQPADPALRASLVAGTDLAALVCPAPDPGLEMEAGHVASRHWEVHRALLHGRVVPAPVGIVFADEEAVRAFLTESHASLHGAMERVGGRWEFRLHVDVVDPGFARQMALDLATHIYAELRRISAAAVTLPAAGQRVLSAAFLVERGSSSGFQDKLDVLARLNSALQLDLTGPWPAYDFVQMRASTGVAAADGQHGAH